MKTTINNQSVAVEIVPDAAELSPLEQDTLVQLDQALQSHPDFLARYPKAGLVRVDSMRTLPDNEEGRYYLRYTSAVGMVEFWGCLARRNVVDCKRGMVGVVANPAHPKLAKA